MSKGDEDVLKKFGMADNRVDINLGAITHNWLYLDNISPKSTVTAAMIKANGYGLGANPVGEALYKAGCREFFVANLDEAVSFRSHLKNSNITDVQIMVLHGCHRGQEHDLRSHGLTPVLNDLEQLSRWRLSAQNANETYPALLHLDTGMTRLGFDPDQTGRWSVGGSGSPRLGVSDTMRVRTTGGYYWITARDGAEGRPLVKPLDPGSVVV